MADIDPLRNFAQLTHLTLLENPVSRKEVRRFVDELNKDFCFLELTFMIYKNYRYWIVWRVPSVRFLDYQKVKDAERAKATELFGSAEEPSALASKIMGIKSRTFDVPSAAANGRAPGGKSMRLKLTDKERKRVEKMIREAKSLEEIARLEKKLNEGRIPGGVLGGDEMET